MKRYSVDYDDLTEDENGSLVTVEDLREWIKNQIKMYDLENRDDDVSTGRYLTYQELEVILGDDD